jgi:hypothetical protein
LESKEKKLELDKRLNYFAKYFLLSLGFLLWLQRCQQLVDRQETRPQRLGRSRTGKSLKLAGFDLKIIFYLYKAQSYHENIQVVIGIASFGIVNNNIL